ncbi:MAG TPA: phosphoribosyltransferase family protein [Pilimelia sp.]|nr:phosphoribosyltransferase family protein [Pilimelia sp.]
MPDRIFANRDDAGRALAAKVVARLGDLASQRPAVLALPRGGVPVARHVADALDADLDVVVARKIGLPWQPELGIGAVTADGPARFDHDLLRRLGLDPRALAPVVERERAEARRRLQRYRGDRPPPPITGRPVIVVDDGLATGVTARAALRDLRTHRPAWLVFAAPVCARSSAAALTAEADDLISVQQPADFHAVGAWYDDFAQLTDDDVERQLAAARRGARLR